MGALRTPREKWVEAGLQALADGGPDAVRVEALAKGLGVTKGGFYGYFADRGALLEEMLDTWERRAVDDVLERVGREAGDVREGVRLARRMFTDGSMLPIDLAVRDWARRDRAVAQRLERVDGRRMQFLREAIGSLCRDAGTGSGTNSATGPETRSEVVEARCLLAFCLAIGQHFLAAEHPGHTPEQVRARAADLVLNVGADR